MQQVGTSIGQKIKDVFIPRLRPYFVSLDPDDAYTELVELIENRAFRNMSIYGWDPEVDGREGFGRALKSAMMRKTNIPFSGPMCLEMRAIFEKGETPKVISDLEKEYKERIMIRELERALKKPLFKIVDAGALDEYAIELVVHDGRQTLRKMYKANHGSLKVADFAAYMQKEIFNKEMYS